MKKNSTSRTKKILTLIPLRLFAGALLGISIVGSATATEIINFVPGTYDLALYDFGPPIDSLEVSVTGGTAFFDLSGADNATFTVPDGSTPSGDFGDLTSDYGAPFFIFADTSATASWDTTAYPAIIFFDTENQGGFGSGYYGDDIYFFFELYTGPAQVFTISFVPEPLTLSVFGAGLAGVVAMRRRKAKSDQRQLCGSAEIALTAIGCTE